MWQLVINLIAKMVGRGLQVEDAPISFFRTLPIDDFFSFYSGATIDVFSTKTISTFQASAIARISTKQPAVGVVQCKNKYKEEDEQEFYAIFFSFKFVGFCFCTSKHERCLIIYAATYSSQKSFVNIPYSNVQLLPTLGSWVLNCMSNRSPEPTVVAHVVAILVRWMGDLHICMGITKAAVQTCQPRYSWEKGKKPQKKGEAKYPKSSMSFSLLCTILVFDH